MTLELWLMIGGFGGAAGIALVGMLWGFWYAKRLDAVHGDFRQAAVTLETARGEVEKLHDALKATNDALVEEQRSHRDEAASLRGDLATLRVKLAATASPAAIEEGLTRRALPTLPMGSRTPGPVKK